MVLLVCASQLPAQCRHWPTVELKVSGLSFQTAQSLFVVGFLASLGPLEPASRQSSPPQSSGRSDSRRRSTCSRRRPARSRWACRPPGLCCLHTRDQPGRRREGHHIYNHIYIFYNWPSILPEILFCFFSPWDCSSPLDRWYPGSAGRPRCCRNIPCANVCCKGWPVCQPEVDKPIGFWISMQYPNTHNTQM